MAVIILAKAAERRPHQVTVGWRRPKIAVEDELAILLRDVELIALGIENLDAVLRPFGEGSAMPGIFSEPSVRGSGALAQPGISSLVRRADPGEISGQI